jgi:hypothetical protein
MFIYVSLTITHLYYTLKNIIILRECYTIILRGFMMKGIIKKILPLV